MPILERDPWREQYFTSSCCPDDVIIPTDDPDCCVLFPQYRWVYEKLLIAKSQGLDAELHGVMPKHYPVFSKPNINLKGMGVGSLIIHSEPEMRRHHNCDYMWMPFLTGEHISSDCAVVDGTLVWIRHATGYATVGGMFHYWKIPATRRRAAIQRQSLTTVHNADSNSDAPYCGVSTVIAFASQTTFLPASRAAKIDSLPAFQPYP